MSVSVVVARNKAGSKFDYSIGQSLIFDEVHCGFKIMSIGIKNRDNLLPLLCLYFGHSKGQFSSKVALKGWHPKIQIKCT